MAARGAMGKNVRSLIQFGRRGQQQADVQGNLARRAFSNPYDRERHGMPLPGRLNALQEHKRKQAMHELQEIQKVLNERGALERNRDALKGDEKELHDLKTLFFNALAEGEIRSMKEFYGYLKEWLAETHQNPKMAEYAAKAYWKLARSFNPRQRKALDMRFKNLAIIARGGDPYD